MPARARKLALIGSLVVVAVTSCTPGQVPAPSSSSSVDLPAVSRLGTSSTTTAPLLQPASANPQSVGPSSLPRASTVTSSPSPSNEQARLTRPLHLPILGAGQTCPVSSVAATHSPDFGPSALGVGPVDPVANSNEELISNTTTPGWLAIKSLWFSEPKYQGPFLVRIRRLDGPGPAGLLEDPTVTSFFVPAGPTALSFPDGFRTVTGATWVKTPGCVAWQVDGLTFSNVIVIQLQCRRPCACFQQNANNVPPSCCRPRRPLPRQMVE